MRSVWLTLLGSSFLVLAGLIALNWRAQLQTHQKLDALTAALAQRPQPTPTPAAPTPEPRPVPHESSSVAPSPYVIEAPDVLLIEAVLKDPATGRVERLPKQPISGAFLVRPDGTISLGKWGIVSVSGLSVPQATEAVRGQLAKSNSPANLKVQVDVHSYNSKCYYVITDDAYDGQQIVRLPLTGNETVLDAIAHVGGITDGAGKQSIRVVRRSPDGAAEILPVDWRAITQNGETNTNYPLMPADRLYLTKDGE